MPSMVTSGCNGNPKIKHDCREERMDQKIAPLILPVKEAAARDANVRAVVNRLHSGECVPVSPCDSMFTPWSKEERADLHSALQRIFPEKFRA